MLLSTASEILHHGRCHAAMHALCQPHHIAPNNDRSTLPCRASCHQHVKVTLSIGLAIATITTQRQTHLIVGPAAQRSLCLELVNRLQRHSAVLVRATAFAAELDCLIALACGARNFNLCQPELTPDDVLHIKAGAAFLASCLQRCWHRQTSWPPSDAVAAAACELHDCMLRAWVPAISLLAHKCHPQFASLLILTKQGMSSTIAHTKRG